LDAAKTASGGGVGAVEDLKIVATASEVSDAQAKDMKVCRLWSCQFFVASCTFLRRPAACKIGHRVSFHIICLGGIPRYMLHSGGDNANL